MDFDELSALNSDFAKEAEQFVKEFSDLFEKWKKKSLRLTVVMAIHMPINNIMNMIKRDKDCSLPRTMPDLPEIFERFLKPFMKIKSKWGEISNKEFCELYTLEYDKQFDNFFPSEQDKNNFKEWYEKDKKKHKKENI